MIGNPHRRTGALAVVAVAIVTASFLQPAYGVASQADQHRVRDHHSAQRAGQFRAGNYIVQLRSAAAATYAGGVAGYRKTAGSNNAPFRASSPSVERYSRYLAKRQNAIAQRLGVTVEQRYTVAFNGFAAHLSAHQALALSKSPAVLAVRKDARWHAAGRPVDRTLERHVAVGPYATSDALGLTRHGRPFRGWHPATAGKGVVIGVLDTGYWPESKSFAGAPLRKGGSVSPQHPGPVWRGSTHQTRYLKADGTVFRGLCEAGQGFPASTCNAKVISARFYDDGYRGSVPRSEWATYEFASPRDGGGHGSHTASTAAGDFGVRTTLYAAHDGAITGVAPAAKLAVYKVLWSAADTSQDGGASSDIVAAIDQAVSDGVDVLNFSITGGPANSVDDPVSIALLNAASAGVFVSAAAGNDGPGSSTVGNIGPWVTTAAASTWKNTYGTVRLGNGAKFRGQTLNALGVGGRLVYGGDIARSPSSSDGATAAQCGTNTLQRRQVQGAIVLCDRGGNYFYEKAGEIYAKGGAGLIIGNAAKGKLFADPLYLPTVHVGFHARNRIRHFIRNTTDHARARLLDGSRTGQPEVPTPQIAAFSSRGPITVSGGDILKPDVAAPGALVLAAVAPPSNFGQKFQFYDGTSMATPHIAGLAAYALGRRPHLTPAGLRSAMVTSAHDTRTPSGANSRDVFAQGGGEVSARGLLDPGLVFPAASRDWLGYLEGQGIDTGSSAPAIAAIDLNQPSVAIGSLVAATTVKRTVENVTGTPERYVASFSGSPRLRVRFAAGGSGFAASHTYVIGAHQTRTLRIQITPHDARGTWAQGYITLRSARHHVRIPVAARPVPLSAPETISATGTSGTVTVSGRAGFDGTLKASVSGLVGATPDSRTIDGDGGSFESADVSSFTVPAGARLTRIDADAGAGSNDLDLFLFADDGTPFNPNTDALVAYSASGSADEQILRHVPAGSYWLVVDGFDVVTGGGEFTLTTWNLPGSDAGNLALSPASQHVMPGASYTVDGDYSGLTAGRVYFGRVTIRHQGTEQTAHTDITIRS